MADIRALRIHQEGKGVRASFDSMLLDDLTEGDLVVRVCWSGINYKDALAATGNGRILRRYPLNGGIDLAGEVMSSDNPAFAQGDRVVICGAGLSEFYDGGYSEMARVPSNIAMRLPSGMSLRDSMALGTAGFTAALAFMRMQQMGQLAEMGPILVTGATGGVGSFSLNLFEQNGFEVVALSGKMDNSAYLEALGASRVIDRNALEVGHKPLESASWGGAVDSIGGEVLSWLTRSVRPWGNVACIGQAAGADLNTSVMPFILRGVSLLGINSIDVPESLRNEVWRRLSGDLRPGKLGLIAAREIDFADLPDAFEDYMQGRITGRTVVKIQSEH